MKVVPSEIESARLLWPCTRSTIKPLSGRERIMIQQIIDQPPDSKSALTICKGGCYLSFGRAGVDYGVEIGKVHGIVGMIAIVPLADPSRLVLGTVKIHGREFPLVDFAESTVDELIRKRRELCIIILRARFVRWGLVVDQMAGISDVTVDNIRTPLPEDKNHPEYVGGIVQDDDRPRYLLDVDKVIQSDKSEAQNLQEEC